MANEQAEAGQMADEILWIWGWRTYVEWRRVVFLYIRSVL
jgi:hypothetical protein